MLKLKHSNGLNRFADSTDRMIKQLNSSQKLNLKKYLNIHHKNFNELLKSILMKHISRHLLINL